MYAATHPAMTIKLDSYDEVKFLVALNLLSDCLQKSLAFLRKMHDKELITEQFSINFRDYKKLQIQQKNLLASQLTLCNSLRLSQNVS